VEKTTLDLYNIYIFMHYMSYLYSYSIFTFICMFCRSLFFLLYIFFCTIVLSVLLRFTDSDYPFGIFKLFLDCIMLNIKGSSI